MRDLPARQLVERREEDRREWMTLRRELVALGPVEIPSDVDLERLRAAVQEGERDLKLTAAGAAWSLTNLRRSRPLGH
jgi:hypothetical protein